MKRTVIHVVLSMFAVAALAQGPASHKVASLDLAHAHARGAFPEGIKCEKSGKHEKGELALTIAPLPRTSYSPGEAIVYTLRVENVGAKPFSIPWSPDPGVLPRNRKLDRYVISSFRVAAYTACGAANLPESQLYGDPSVPGSWLQLKPHEYAEIKLETALRGIDECRPREATPVQLRVTMAQSAPARRTDDACAISFFQGYHVANPVEITMSPVPPPMKKALQKAD